MLIYVVNVCVCCCRSKLAGRYEQHVSSAISSHEAAAGVRLGALLIEPVLQGAGGMLLVDPLFQKVLVQVRLVWGGPAEAGSRWAQGRQHSVLLWRGGPKADSTVFCCGVNSTNESVNE